MGENETAAPRRPLMFQVQREGGEFASGGSITVGSADYERTSLAAALRISARDVESGRLDEMLGIDGEPPEPALARHPSIADLLFLFRFEHLPLELQDVVRPFAALAFAVADGPSNAETTTALRKLLEAKDCAARALVLAGRGAEE